MIWYISIYIYVYLPFSDFNRKNVGKYNSPMDNLAISTPVSRPQANRKAFGRASGVVVPTGLMVQTRRIVSSWMFEVPPVGGIFFPFVVVVVVVVEVLFSLLFLFFFWWLMVIDCDY